VRIELHPSATLDAFVISRQDGRYQQAIADLHDGDPTSWERGPSNENHDRVGCVCGQTFNTIFASDIHVHSSLVGSNHDIAPEAQPRLAAAWVLLDVDEEKVFQAVIAAGTRRLCSRDRHVESSTSAEQRTVLCALQDVKDMLPKNSALLLSTDSDGTRQAIEECCLRYFLPRQFTRTPEAGTLRAILGHTDDLQTKKIDVQAALEPACHDRVKRHSTARAGRTLARLNHACDRLADMAVMTGRETKLEFHQPFSTQHATSDYITSGGAPMTTDSYKEVAQCAASVLVQAILTQEYSIPPSQRKGCTRFMRLTVCGDVDAT